MKRLFRKYWLLFLVFGVSFALIPTVVISILGTLLFLFAMILFIKLFSYLFGIEGGCYGEEEPEDNPPTSHHIHVYIHKKDD